MIAYHDSSDPDPLYMVGTEFAQDYVFAEIIDLSYDENEEVVWAVGQGGLMLFDVSIPESPAFLRAYSPMGWHDRAYHLHQQDSEKLFISHRDHGFVAYNTQNPMEAQIGMMTNLRGAAGLLTHDEYLFVCDLFGALHVYNTTDAEPEPLFELTGLGSPWRMARQDEILFVADNQQGLIVVDIEVPAQPLVIDRLEGSGGIQDVALSEQYLYTAAGGLGIDIFDISAPENPIWIGNVPTSYSALEVVVDGDILWAVSHQDLMAFDISNGAQPQMINTEKTTQWAMAVDAHGGHAFVGDWGYLSIFSVSEGVRGGDLHVASSQVYVGQDEETEVVLRNVGNDTVVIYNGSVSRTGLEGSISKSHLDVGEEAVLSIRQNDGDGGRLCIASSDDDTPLQYIDIVGAQDSPLGLPAPEFSLPTLDGETFNLSEWSGSYVVMVYFATW